MELIVIAVILAVLITLTNIWRGRDAIDDHIQQYQYGKRSASFSFSPPDRNAGNQFMSAEEKQEYLKSSEWQSLRKQIFERDNHACQKCGSRHSLECHHLTYSNLGSERLYQLTTLCRICHSELHKQLGYDRKTVFHIR